ncbi:GNAT family N-acetyltransferase [Bosea sp. 685]|uniref:GNAT family N-acetyltransferase n=1 Tax=Bosea sp. 685 TaxID=3080057 RepID=UPI002892C430|nr:GNAT family N-acetyltransferase [Bosea sp. 685]WNJ88005.1 GNAT family N-acetyltransferase [Bosea sp. 685]
MNGDDLSIQIRPMNPQDLGPAAILSGKIDWPHRRQDWDFMFSVGEGLVAVSGGEVQGTVMAFRHGPKLATLGMVIVDGALQGRGVGRRLMQEMIARLDGSAILLQATKSGVPLYRGLGFDEVGDLYQHQGLVPEVAPPVLAENETIRRVAAPDGRLEALYSRASGADKAKVMTALFSQAQCAMLLRDGTPAGFAMLREFGRGLCIGPVVASDRRAAQVLIQHWLAGSVGRFTRVDLAGDESVSMWLEGLGMPRKDGTLTMTYGAMPPVADDVILFGLAAHALG